MTATGFCQSTKGYSFVHVNFSLRLTATERQCLAKAYAKWPTSGSTFSLPRALTYLSPCLQYVQSGEQSKEKLSHTTSCCVVNVRVTVKGLLRVSCAECDVEKSLICKPTQHARKIHDLLLSHLHFGARPPASIPL